jgi:hypothetical protein
MGFYAKGFDGRIDDRMRAGRAASSGANGDHAPWLMEGGRARAHAPCIQLRPTRWR